MSERVRLKPRSILRLNIARRLTLLLAAIVLTGCANAATADNCLYVVKYEGKMLKWYSCKAPPAMVSTRMTKG